MNERELAAAYDLDGAFNRIVVDLAPQAEVRRVMVEVDRVLSPYGGLTAYERRNHSSDKHLTGEINILKAWLLPFRLFSLAFQHS